MKKLLRTKHSSHFVPDYMAVAVGDIDFAELKRRGVRYVAFDADSTLVHSRGTKLSSETLLLLKKQRKYMEGWCIASNRLPRDLELLAKSIDAGLIQANLFTRKPSKRFFKRVLAYFDAKPEEVAMIGDKLFADIWGAKRVGMITVWVEHLGTDLPWDQLFQTRRIERFLLKRYGRGSNE